MKALTKQGCGIPVLLMCILGVPGIAVSNDSRDPAELMRKSDERHRIQYETTQQTMVLQPEKGDAQQRTLVSYVHQNDESGDRMLLRFTAPGGIRNTAFLTIEQGRGKANDQWLYLPAFNRTRRLGEADLGDRFVGSDIFFEDLKRRYVEDYSYKMLRTEACGEHTCYVIESSPSDPKVKEESPYSKSHIWLRKDSLLGIRVRHFDSRDRPWKEMILEDVKQVEGNAWRGNRAIFTDLQRRHRTVLIVNERDVNQAISDDTFSQHNLGDE